MHEVTMVVSISKPIADEVERLSVRTGVTKSMIVEKALEANIDCDSVSHKSSNKETKVLLDITARSLLLLQKNLSFDEKNKIANQARALIEDAL